MTYSGWIKAKRGRWREACRHATLDGCWKALLAMRVAGDCERMVVPTDQPPAAGVKRPPESPGLFDQEGRP